MAVTAPVSLSKIKTEFSGPNEFSAYIRGGTYVPNTAPNAAISTTVAGLAMSTFLGASDFTPFTDVYTSGSATITAPAGATSVTIKAWGGGGGGGGGLTVGAGDAGGGGGGSGGYVAKTLSVTGGTTQFTYAVGVGGDGAPEDPEIDAFEEGEAGTDSTVTGAGGSVNIVAGGGGGGFSANWDSGLNVYAGTGGPFGGTSGGDVNTNGNSGGDSPGTTGGTGGSAPNGGSGGLGGGAVSDPADPGGSPGGGGGGGGTTNLGSGNDNGGDGARGEIWFEWS